MRVSWEQSREKRLVAEEAKRIELTEKEALRIKEAIDQALPVVEEVVKEGNEKYSVFEHLEIAYDILEEKLYQNPTA